MDEELRLARQEEDWLKVAQLYLRSNAIPEAYDAAVRAFVDAGGHQNCLGNNPRCEGRVFCNDDGDTGYNYICFPHSAKDAHDLLEIIRNQWDSWEYDYYLRLNGLPKIDSRRNPDEDLRSLERKALSGDPHAIYNYLVSLRRANLLRPDLRNLYDNVIASRQPPLTTLEDSIKFLDANFQKHQVPITHCKCKKFAEGPCGICGVGLCLECFDVKDRCIFCNTRFCKKDANENLGIDNVCASCVQQDLSEESPFYRNPDEEDRRHERKFGQDERYWINRFRKGDFEIEGFQQISDPKQRANFAKTWHQLLMNQRAQLPTEEQRPLPVAVRLLCDPTISVKKAIELEELYNQIEKNNVASSTVALSIIKEIRNAEDQLVDNSEILMTIDTKLEGFGVESVELAYDGREESFEYVNQGDTYADTVGFCSIRDKFVVSSWGDWMEFAEQTMHVQHCPNCGIVFDLDNENCPGCGHPENEEA